MIEPVRLGLVGCGRLAEQGYVPALTLAADVRLVAVADADSARCASVASGIPSFVSAEALLAAADVELLVLAHPPGEHVGDAQRAAAAGVAALVEKPPARTAAEAEGLLGLGPAPFLGLNRRFEPGAGATRQRLMDEPPERVELEMSLLPSAWGAVTGSAPALLDVGPHLVDLATWLTGRKAAAIRVERYEPEEAAFELDLGGPVASLQLSHRRSWHERVAVRYRDGRSLILSERGGLMRRLLARARPGGQGPLVESLAAQLTAAAHAVRGGDRDERLGTADDGLSIMRVLDAVSTVRTNQWVTL